MATWLAGVSLADGAQRLEVLEQAPEQTVEVQLAQARAAIDASSFLLAAELLDQILTDNPWEWRAMWLSGLAALAQSDDDAAATAFNTALGQVPGELAPKLALALACEQTGDFDLAEQLYAVCAATDANYVAAAAFGLARARERGDDQPGALAALDLVAPTSSAYAARAPSSGRAAHRVRSRPRRAGGGCREHRRHRDRSRERLTLQAQILVAAHRRGGTQRRSAVDTMSDRGRDRGRPPHRRRARVPRAGDAHVRSG